MKTIVDLFERSCARFPDNPYLWEKRGGCYVSVSYSFVRERVLKIAAGLLGSGLEKGDRVALLSEGCNDWVCGELGILYAGAINVPLSMKLTEQELVFRLNHSATRFLFISTHYLNVLEHIFPELPFLERVFVFGDYAGVPGRFQTFDRLIEEGEEWLRTRRDELDRVMSSVEAGDVANISYTSGTTAAPKGIMLTHGNYVSNVLQSDSLIQIPAYYKILLFLPWDHSFAHTVGIYSFMYNGASLASVDFGKSPMEYLRNIPVNLKEVQPHILLSVPAIAKNFRKNIENAIKQKGRLAGWLYRNGLKLAYYYNGLGTGKGGRSVVYPLVKLFDVLLFSEIRKSFGGNLQFFIGGGALLDVELQKYFCALGIPMYQGYGLSEASPVISSNVPGEHKFGSSGILVRPMDLKVCDEEGRELAEGEQGEIVIRGGNVMKGYWKNEEGTREAIKDGWLHTGDLGYVSPDGFLYVLGRFKSLLIANDGEKFSPEGIEESVVEKSPYIDYCILYNNQSPYTSALIVPNKGALKDYLRRKNAEPGSIEGYKLMLGKINREFMDYRHGGKYDGLFPERWLPAVIGVLPESLGEHNGTINSASKLVRRRVMELFKEELDVLYTTEGKDIQNARNTQNIKHFFENH